MVVDIFVKVDFVNDIRRELGFGVNILIIEMGSYIEVFVSCWELLKFVFV